MSTSEQQPATSILSKIRAWIEKFRSHKRQKSSTERGATASQADKMSTASSEPVVRAVREPYEDSPDFAEFRRKHSGYGRAPFIHVNLEVIGAPGIGVRSLVNKLVYDDMYGGERLRYTEMMMMEEKCLYYCGGKIYDLDVFPKPYPALWDNESGLLDERMMQLLEERRRDDQPGYSGVRNHRSVVFAYDISSRASFEELMARYDDLLGYYNQVHSVSPVTLLGLKADVSDNEREVSKGELSGFAASHGCLSGECSARTGWGVDDIFSRIAEGVHTVRVRIEEGNRSTPPVH